MIPRLRSWFDAALRRKQFEGEMDRELQGHIQAFTEDLVRRGVPRPEAERQARREFGAMQLYKDECRDARGLRWVDELVRDLRYALRLLWKNPAFTLTAVMTLALCIGANTAVYSVVDAVLFRPLPYPDPGRLASVILLWRGHGMEDEQTNHFGRTWEAVRDGAKNVDAAVFNDASNGVNLALGGTAQYVKQQRVSSGFFRVLGVSPLLGREFTRTEDRVGGPAVAVLSHSLWRRAFGADPSIVGGKIILRGEPYTVVGVMPPNFQSNTSADLWTPLRPSTTGEGGGSNYRILARLRPSSSWAEANSEVERAGESVARTMNWRPSQRASVQLVSLQRGLTEWIRTPLLIIWAAVGLVLLIGCVNVAGLLLARAGVRSREIATRMALGSSKSAIVRQLLAESLLLAVIGGVAGIVLGYFALEGLKAWDLSTLNVSEAVITLNTRVLGFTSVVALLTSLLFGFYPALQMARVDIRSALTQGGARGVSVSYRAWARRSLVIAEVALGVVLLVSAGLLLRTLAHLTGLQPGFDSSHVMAASLSLQDARYATADKTMRLFDQSLLRIRSVPGIESAGIGLTLPYQRALNDGVKRLDGSHPDSEWQTTNVVYVTPGYFETLHMPLLRGRRFDGRDRTGTQPVVIVNEAFVRRYLQGQDAIGSHLELPPKCEIVGVIGDVQQGSGWGDYGPLDAVPGIYIPAAQMDSKSLQSVHTWLSPYWIVRTSLPRQSVIEQLRRAVAGVDPQLPFADFQSMDEIRAGSVAFQRVTATLLVVLAGLATLLAAIGIYGLIAHSVVERTREMGIRMALGATVTQAVRAVSMPGITLASGGLVIGCILALGAAHILRSLIWGVQPTDPITFGCVCGALLLVAALASLLPGVRVARIQPAESLRHE